MLARIRKAMEEREEGFTLIELLVVIIIIGILAAIAIPVFLNQRQKGYDAQAKSDLRNAATAEETYLTDNPTTYTTNFAADLVPLGFKQSATLVGHFGIAISTNAGYCIVAKSQSGRWFAYDSGLGGLQTTYTTTAPTTSTWTGTGSICAAGLPSPAVT